MPIPFLNQYFMKSQLNEMIKDLVNIYRDCKKDIFEDNLFGVVVSKTFGWVVSVRGGIAGYAATGALEEAGTTAEIAGTAATATAGATGALSTGAKVAVGLGVEFLLLGITGVISQSIGRSDWLEFSEKILNLFQEIFVKNFKKEDYIKTIYESFINSINTSKRIMNFLSQDKHMILHYIIN